MQVLAGTWPRLHSEVIISHATAAACHGLPLFSDLLTRVWLTRRLGGHGRVTRRLRVSLAETAEDEVTSIAGLPVTSLARTTLDLARSLPLRRGVAVVDAALRRGLSRDDLLALAVRYPRRPGLGRAVRAIGLGDPRSESVGESESRVVLHQLGLPTPTLQFEVRAHGVLLGRSDFAWEEHRLLGEFDGRIKYDGLVRPGQSAADVIMAEKRREQRLRDANWWVVRWTYDSLNRPEELARTIRAGFQQARAFRALSDSPAWAEDGQPPAA